MKTTLKLTAIATRSALFAATLSLPYIAADVPAAVARMTFDGNIKNKSLALRPDESTAVVSYSERPDGGKLYVTNFLGDKVTIVDTQPDKAEGEITGFSNIRGILVTADGKTMFAANSGTNNIAVVDIAKREILSTVTADWNPAGYRRHVVESYHVTIA